MLSLGWIQAVAGVRASRLFPFILTLVVIGTVGERHAVSDLGILAFLGLLGYSMSTLDWPRAPLMLGFVLGPVLERRCLLSQSVYGWSWMLRPSVLVLAGLTAAFVYATTWSRAAPVALTSGGAGAGRGNAVFALTLALFASAGLWFTAPLAARAAAFPRAAFGAMLVSSVACAWSLRRQPARSSSEADADTAGTHLARIGWLAAFVVSTWLLGLVVGAAVAAVAHSRAEARETWRSVVAVSAATGVTAYLLVSQVLHIADQGMALQWLTR
jgi:hypothetical protein